MENGYFQLLIKKKVSFKKIIFKNTLSQKIAKNQSSLLPLINF